MTEGESKEQDNTSMEEILQTIRGVISGEGSDNADSPPNTDNNHAQNNGQSLASPPANEAVQTEATDDILELTDMVETPPPESSEVAEKKELNETPQKEETVAPEIDSEEDCILDNIDNMINEEQSSQPSETEDEATKEETTTNTGDKLVSGSAAEDSKEALKALMQSIPKPNVSSPTLRSGTSLEELVIEAIKPILSEWLEQNLAIIVKQIVEKEIKKLIPKDDE